MAETTDGFVSSCCLLFGGSRCNSSHAWRSSELHTRNNTSTSLSFEVIDDTCPVLSMENTFSVHVTAETTQNIVEIPNCARSGDLTGISRGSGTGKDPHLIRRSGPVEKSFM